MNINECINILSQRTDISQKCKCNSSACFERLTSTDSTTSKSFNSLSRQEIEKYSNIELLNLFTSLQSDRIMTYASYESFFSTMLSSRNLNEYPILCAEMTSRFASLSSNIGHIKSILQERNSTTAFELVKQVQEQEKEKLTLIAANHLDRMHEIIPLQTKVSNNILFQPNLEYTVSQIAKIESNITDLMTEIQAEKCDI